ncbi:MAG: SDR family NAD(P)-dependent oxidoreductase, partial [Alphaproteobacteria bacterium]
MDLQLAGTPCLVTGASTGIGAAIAAALAAEGARVAITARRLDLLEGVADRIAAAGAPRPVPIAADLTAPDGPARVAEAACRALDHVAVLVNNMGNARPMTWDAPEEAWDEGWTLNFDAARRLTTLLVPG